MLVLFFQFTCNVLNAQSLQNYSNLTEFESFIKKSKYIFEGTVIEEPKVVKSFNDLKGNQYYSLLINVKVTNAIKGVKNGEIIEIMRPPVGEYFDPKTKEKITFSRGEHDYYTFVKGMITVFVCKEHQRNPPKFDKNSRHMPLQIVEHFNFYIDERETIKKIRLTIK